MRCRANYPLSSKHLMFIVNASIDAHYRSGGQEEMTVGNDG